MIAALTADCLAYEFMQVDAIRVMAEAMGLATSLGIVKYSSELVRKRN